MCQGSCDWINKSGDERCLLIIITDTNFVCVFNVIVSRVMDSVVGLVINGIPGRGGFDISSHITKGGGFNCDVSGNGTRFDAAMVPSAVLALILAVSIA